MWVNIIVCPFLKWVLKFEIFVRFRALCNICVTLLKHSYICLYYFIHYSTGFTPTLSRNVFYLRRGIKCQDQGNRGHGLRVIPCLTKMPILAKPVTQYEENYSCNCSLLCQDTFIQSKLHVRIKNCVFSLQAICILYILLILLFNFCILLIHNSSIYDLQYWNFVDGTLFYIIIFVDLLHAHDYS